MFNRIFYTQNVKKTDFAFLSGKDMPHDIGTFIDISYDDKNIIICKIPIKGTISDKETFFILPSLSWLNNETHSYRFILQARKERENGSYFHMLDTVGIENIESNEIAKYLSIENQKLHIEKRIDYFGDVEFAECLYLIVKGIKAEEFSQLKACLAVTMFSQGHADGSSIFNQQIKIDVPSISQMEQPKDISNRICSSMSTSMILKSYGIKLDPLELAAREYSSAQQDYGVWPRNVWAAAQYGVLGMVTALCSYEELIAVLKSHTPIVATLTYQKGELYDAAVPETKGHLVVIKGVDGDRVLVNDPAGKTSMDVERSYDMKEFAKAWLKNKHGICYIFQKP